MGFPRASSLRQCISQSAALTPRPAAAAVLRPQSLSRGDDVVVVVGAVFVGLAVVPDGLVHVGDGCLVPEEGLAVL